MIIAAIRLRRMVRLMLRDFAQRCLACKMADTPVHRACYSQACLCPCSIRQEN